MRENMIERVRLSHPLIHCITNYVTAGDVANVVLAAGASPIMSDGVNEVEDVVSLCQALVLNLGTLDERKLNSMIKAGKKANCLDIPVIFDPVGAGASAFRTQSAMQILSEVKLSVIRGNVSEINAIAGRKMDSRGVDAGLASAVTEETIDAASEFLKSLSREYHAVMVMTGNIDVVAEEDRYGLIRNGHPWMARITGSGCMLDGLIASFVAGCTVADQIPRTLSPDNIFDAAVTALSVSGLCGELAYESAKNLGTGSFRTMFIDAVSCMTDERWKDGAKIEIR